jgi:hypothetical protein
MMTKFKTFRLIPLGDAKRLTKGLFPGGLENMSQPNHTPAV